MQLMCDPFPHIAHRPAAIPLALSPLNPPPKQTSSNPSTLFPAFQTASRTIPPLRPAISSPQNPPSLLSASTLIPHSLLPPRPSPPAISCLGAFQTPAVSARREVLIQASENLVWGDFCQGGTRGAYPFISTPVSLFDLASRFFVPTHDRIEPARAEAVKDGA